MKKVIITVKSSDSVTYHGFKVGTVCEKSIASKSGNVLLTQVNRPSRQFYVAPSEFEDYTMWSEIKLWFKQILSF